MARRGGGANRRNQNKVRPPLPRCRNAENSASHLFYPSFAPPFDDSGRGPRAFSLLAPISAGVSREKTTRCQAASKAGVGWTRNEESERVARKCRQLRRPIDVRHAPKNSSSLRPMPVPQSTAARASNPVQRQPLRRRPCPRRVAERTLRRFRYRAAAKATRRKMPQKTTDIRTRFNPIPPLPPLPQLFYSHVIATRHSSFFSASARPRSLVFETANGCR